MNGFLLTKQQNKNQAAALCHGVALFIKHEAKLPVNSLLVWMHWLEIATNSKYSAPDLFDDLHVHFEIQHSLEVPYFKEKMGFLPKNKFEGVPRGNNVATSDNNMLAREIRGAQYGLPTPPAFRPHASPPQEMPYTSAFSMHMLSSNYPAHINWTAHSSNKTLNNLEIQLLHPEIRQMLLPPGSFNPHQEAIKNKKRNRHHNTRNGHRQTTTSTMSSAASTDEITTAKIVVSCTKAQGGGTIVSSRDGKGQIHMRIEYDRNEQSSSLLDIQMLRFSHSPYAVLPPACLKDIVMDTPEILSRFPQRHGIDLSPSCEM
ncbi:unnamed protein product [Angiostrongylus costaricensis]|uniref:NDC10_II domain-containing protein n=1 Tax=Angiostrongylus costaricensis TaxID=334426 RepID=A0A0R3PMV1_ANGCS|nr:unnamed protein product [Angiostrongylus costaricensis]